MMDAARSSGGKSIRERVGGIVYERGRVRGCVRECMRV